MPTGGTTGQLLKKASGTNFDLVWFSFVAGTDYITPTQLISVTDSLQADIDSKSKIRRASAVLTKIETVTPATSAAVTLTLLEAGTFGTLTITVNGTPHDVTFGEASSGATITTYSDDGTTITTVPADIVSASLRSYLDGAGMGPLAGIVTFGNTDPSIDLTTVATGTGATISVSVTAGIVALSFASMPSDSAGTDIVQTGVRQIQLAAAVIGKAHHIDTVSHAVNTTGWVDADVEIGYESGGVFTRVLGIFKSRLGGDTTSFGGSAVNPLENDLANLINPPGGALVARTASIADNAPLDESTGGPLSLLVAFTTE